MQNYENIWEHGSQGSEKTEPIYWVRIGKEEVIQDRVIQENTWTHEPENTEKVEVSEISVPAQEYWKGKALKDAKVQAKLQRPLLLPKENQGILGKSMLNYK